MRDNVIGILVVVLFVLGAISVVAAVLKYDASRTQKEAKAIRVTLFLPQEANKVYWPDSPVTCGLNSVSFTANGQEVILYGSIEVTRPIVEKPQ